MKRFATISSIFIILIAAALTGGCKSTPATSAPNAVPPLTPPASAAGPTYGSMAASGQAVFANRCAGCHGAGGQGGGGPAIIGAGSALGKYGTGKGLLDFISVRMPRNAPGSLPRQDYLNVVSYLLVQNNFAFPATAFDENGLTGIQIK